MTAPVSTPMPTFEMAFVATPETIDEMGHVNNAVWVQWIQAVATGHWFAAAAPEHAAAYVWVVIRHEIDYLRGLGPGGQVTARTWIEAPPAGARFDRLVEFTGEGGKAHVRARTSWVMLDRATGRPLRVPPEVVSPFLGPR